MPINTYTCPECGAHINYSIDIGAYKRKEAQEIQCKRCSAVVRVSPSEIPERVCDTIAMLEADQRLFDNSDIDSNLPNDDETDSVEEALKKFDSELDKAKAEIKLSYNDYDDEASFDTNFDKIIDDYIPNADFLEVSGDKAKEVLIDIAAPAVSDVIPESLRQDVSGAMNGDREAWMDIAERLLSDSSVRNELVDLVNMSNNTPFVDKIISNTFGVDDADKIKQIIRYISDRV